MQNRYFLRIRKIQKALGFPLAEFPEVDPSWDDDVEHLNYEEQLTPEDRELKQEEEQEEAESWEGL